MKTTTLEISQKLAECLNKHGLEVPESYFTGYIDLDDNFGITDDLGSVWCDIKQSFPVYTLCELLEVLPMDINNFKYVLRLFKTDRFKGFPQHEYCYNVSYRHADDGTIALEVPLIIGTNPADAAAQLLIWCIENGYLTCIGETQSR